MATQPKKIEKNGENSFGWNILFKTCIISLIILSIKNSILNFLLVELKNFGVFQIENFLNSSIHTLLLWRQTTSKEFSPFFSIFFRQGCHLWTQFSQLLMGQIEQFWCLSDREFHEFFKNGPTFYSSSTQWPSVTIFHKSQFFWGHPVCNFLSFLFKYSLNFNFERKREV